MKYLKFVAVAVAGIVVGTLFGPSILAKFAKKPAASSETTPQA